MVFHRGKTITEAGLHFEMEGEKGPVKIGGRFQFSIKFTFNASIKFKTPQSNATSNISISGAKCRNQAVIKNLIKLSNLVIEQTRHRDKAHQE